MQETVSRSWRIIPVAVLALGGVLILAPQASAQIATGTVMASTGSGKVTEFSQAGAMGPQLDTATGAAFTTGSVFDSLGNFYVTDFDAQQVTKFDPTGSLIGPFGSGYNADPESIITDSSLHFYVGQAGGTHHVLEFDSSGTLLATFSPATELVGTDWTVIGADQCTLYYTSEGKRVLRFNACTNTQLPDFNTAPLPGSKAFALKLLPGGGVLVADTDRVVRLDATGALAQTYFLPGGTGLFALSLDPDGTSFWSGDFNNSDAYKVDIASGTVLQQFPTNGAPGYAGLFGLSVKGEIIVSQGNKCPLSQGFWNNHSKAWPVTTLTLGSQTYTEAELLTILQTSVTGDASLILAHQLIAAKLNIANGSNAAPVGSTITDADSLLSLFSGKLPYGVDPNSANGQRMVNDATTLDNYNNGALTPNCTQ
jgi:hypothetical protein